MTKAVPEHGDCARNANSQHKPKSSGPSGKLKEAGPQAGRRPILFVPGAPDFGPHLEELLTLAGITSTYDTRGDLDSNLQQAWATSAEERTSQQQRPAPELVRQLKSSIKQTQRLLARFERSHVRDIHFIQAPVGEDEGTVNTATVRDMILGSGPSLPRNPPPLARFDHIVGAGAAINTQRVLDRLLRELDRNAPKRKRGNQEKRDKREIVFHAASFFRQHSNKPPTTYSNGSFVKFCKSFYEIATGLEVGPAGLDSIIRKELGSPPLGS
jgi:hypothetical protein